MNLEYINNLPEVKNKFNVELEEGERVVFATILSTFGTEKDRLLGGDNSKFTFTNKRIIFDNGVGIWTVNISEDIIDCKKIKSGFFIFKFTYFLINLNHEVEFGDGEKLTGFNVYFKKKDISQFENIINNLFGNN